MDHRTENFQYGLHLTLSVLGKYGLHFSSAFINTITAHHSRRHTPPKCIHRHTPDMKEVHTASHYRLQNAHRAPTPSSWHQMSLTHFEGVTQMVIIIPHGTYIQIQYTIHIMMDCVQAWALECYTCKTAYLNRLLLLLLLLMLYRVCWSVWWAEHL